MVETLVFRELDEILPRKEIASSRIEDISASGSSPRFLAASSLEQRRKTSADGEAKNCAQGFYFRDLAAATRNFKESNLIGNGGFGRVYKGCLDSGQAVAIKQLNREGIQGSKGLLVEVVMLIMLHHPNLVNLYG